MGPIILDQIMGICDLHQNINEAHLKHDLVIIAGCAIHMLFCVFDSAYSGPHPHYPEPSIRAGVATTQLGIYLADNGVSDAMSLLGQGIVLANTYCQAAGIPQGAYDVGDAYQEWMKTQLPLLDSMSDKLKAHFPCQS